MTSTWILALGILSSSFLGSWHCAGMCSPVAGLMSARRGLWSYHLGRLSSYMLLGLLGGGLGQFFLNSDFIVLRWVSAIALSITLLYSGLSLVYPQFFKRFESLSAWTHHWVLRARRLQAFHLSHSSYGVGFLTAFLPCGWLYTYVLAAIATQSATAGTIVMMLFWLGGLPALSAVPWMLKNLIQTATPQRQRVAGCVLMGAGIYSIGSFFLLH